MERGSQTAALWWESWTQGLREVDILGISEASSCKDAPEYGIRISDKKQVNNK